ncbi:PREDICTED: transcription initiation factor TFIID subunit 11 isoform X2 [Theobroma cacao]|uniref:Transcription initiation factor TFIID subunit 11 isoform X2 n=1 Tax=Theobroma cacao TaxID=3641 RepID=A0AB32WZC4_THECC|nr:PREDICTED: transcription initiation factor TFIID subunit 11 isoform X2 [Theobroma cacao]
MKQSKDPFEAALEEQEESPPDSPIGQDELDSQTPTGHHTLVDDDDYDEIGANTNNPSHPSSNSTPMLLTPSVNASVASAAAASKNKEYDDDEEEENVDVELGKFPSSADPAKMAKMQAILSQFTEDQMSRYESFRRSALQKSNMRRVSAVVNAVVGKHHWKPENFFTNDHCCVWDSKNVCWRTC